MLQERYQIGDGKEYTYDINTGKIEKANFDSQAILDKKMLYQEYNMVIMNEFLVKKNDLIATKKYIRIKPDYAINNN